MRLKGIDVSSYQGNINWKKVKKDKIEFAIIRIGYGMYENGKDVYFEKNYKGCINENIPVGVYFYSYAKNKKEAKAEADLVLKWLNSRKLNLPVYYDLEDKSQINLGKKTLTEMCETFCNTIEKAGYWAGIYTNKYWANIIDGEKLGKRYTYWIAQYSNRNTYKGPYAMWQYSSSGKISGIKGNVDLDYLYEDLMSKIDKKEKKVGVTYWVYDTKKKTWLPKVLNLNDYAGNMGHAISGIYAYPSEGNIKYRVHQKGGNWLPTVQNLENYAGNLGRPIDALQMEATSGTVNYRVHIKGGSWLKFIHQWNDTSSGYAGIYGKEIDAIQIYIK